MIKIVTDSTASLSAAQYKQNDITVIAQKAIFGTTTYRDEIDLTNEQFYKMLTEGKVHPTTSQPSAGEFEQIYQPLLAAGHEIVSIHLSGKLSGTVASANTAKTELETQRKKSVPISIVDTGWVAGALGVVALRGAEAARAGKSREQVVAAVNAVAAKMNLILMVDTLEYLRKGGRIGGAQAMLGTMLNFKPLLEIKGGVIEPLGRERSRAKALTRMVEELEARAGTRALYVVVLHARAEAEAKELEAQVRAKFNVKEYFLSAIGPAIGVHSGPGALGLAFYTD